MTLKLLRIAVVGHTNTGKTSLLRTLTRDPEFGEVSDRPATTRHVEGSAILIDGEQAIELYDTPGLEDSPGLFEHLDAMRTDGRVDGADVIEQFLASDAALGRFAQEAKALRQVMQSDVALYVIDAREQVLGRHRDELTILSWCARPIVPVLNFLASPEARVEHWREHLARTGLHVVSEFDTVVLDDHSEQRLVEKLCTVLDDHRETLQAFLAQRQRERDGLIRDSARLVAELLIDAAALVELAPTDDESKAAEVVERLRESVRQRERECARELLALHRFASTTAETDTASTIDASLGLDLFSPEAMKQFGLTISRGAAIGALAGVTIDAMAHGITLGAAAATGAALGALLETARTHGKRFFRLARQTTEVRVDPQTIRLLALRQIGLVRSLLSRGHASTSPAKPAADFIAKLRSAAVNPLPAMLQRARQQPHWSTLSPVGRFRARADAARSAAARELAELVEQRLRDPTSRKPTFP